MPQWFDDLLRRDFTTFIGKTLSTVDPGADYLPNWHISLIAEYLEAVRRGEINRLVINMPPRYLKSVCVSVAWPAWLLGHDPSSRIIGASYAASLAIKHSVDCRHVMNSPWYQRVFPGTRLSHDQNEKHKFTTTERGYRFATSVGGSTTGEGGNFLIIDDPLNPSQAMNKVGRNHANQWFENTFSTRLDNKKKGAIVLVMQRLHQEDLSGFLLKKSGWEHLCLPAIADNFTHYHVGQLDKVRAQGELLHPEREDRQLIERAKTELGSAAFAAQYQQNPLPEEGSMVRAWWFGRYRCAPETKERIVQSWDTAIKSGSEHDASVCLTFAELEGKAYLLDASVMRVEYPELKKSFYALAQRWKPHAMLIEDRASGQQLIQDIRRESALPVVRTSPNTDKMSRFAAITAMIEAGKLVLPENATWLAAFESEILAFPGGNHDDQVDALTQYLDWFRKHSLEGMRIRNI